MIKGQIIRTDEANHNVTLHAYYPTDEDKVTVENHTTNTFSVWDVEDLNQCFIEEEENKPREKTQREKIKWFMNNYNGGRVI